MHTEQQNNGTAAHTPSLFFKQGACRAPENEAAKARASALPPETTRTGGLETSRYPATSDMAEEMAVVWPAAGTGNQPLRAGRPPFLAPARTWQCLSTNPMSKLYIAYEN
jgi:hypothetical protein